MEDIKQNISHLNYPQTLLYNDMADALKEQTNIHINKVINSFNNDADLEQLINAVGHGITKEQIVEVFNVMLDKHPYDATFEEENLAKQENEYKEYRRRAH